MKKYKWVLISINMVIILSALNYSLMQKEELLLNGRLVLLELAPVDPRSLMQGDYMSLRYAITQFNHNESLPKRGYCIVQIQPDSVAKRVRFQAEKHPMKDGEYLISYTSTSFTVFIGAESYFFQEGQAAKYDSAKYGGLIIDREGHGLLMGLYDSKRRKIQ